MWDIDLLGCRVGVIQHEACREEAPHNYQIPIKTYYLFKLQPCTSSCWLLIVSMILLGVPICFIVSLSVFYVPVLIFFISIFEIIVLSPVLLIQFLEPFTPHKMFSSITLFPMMLIPVQEIFVIFVILKAISDSFLLFINRISHFASATCLPIFPVFIGLLIFKVASRWVSKY